MNRILKFLPLAAALTCGSLAFAVPPVITNVTASQRAGTKLVDITYDITDEDGDLMKVRVEISDNDGNTYSIPAFSLTGDIGDNIASGTGKHIVWDAGTDWDGEYSDLMRVKVFAIDAKGFPGMEWGNEVPPGGFLLGQDGGAEGSGPSRHVNIPWSYWLTKYEVTRQQYCDFLNAAIVTGHVKRDGTTAVRYPSDTTDLSTPSNVYLCPLGDDKEIRWNVNHFEVVNDRGNYPVSVSWYGARAFCEYYGYDLPTHAEWEKAARGPDHDDQDEHLCYPWGNTITAACASYDTRTSSDKYASYIVLCPVGYYDGNQTPIGDDMVNGYGLYDVIGNAAEWTLTRNYSTESYPQEETFLSPRHSKYSYCERTLKGIGRREIYYWDVEASGSTDYCYGFRPVRRVGVKDEWADLVCALKEDFNSWTEKGYGEKTVTTATGTWTMGSYLYVPSTGVDGSMGIYASSSDSNYPEKNHLILPPIEGKIAFIRCKVKSGGYTKELGSVPVAPNQSTFKTIEIPVNADGSNGYKLYIGQYLTIDDLEVWVYPEEETEE